jgi:predicted kinase
MDPTMMDRNLMHRAIEPSSAAATRDPLSHRIWIVGSPGSGKSTLATRLAALLQIEAVHLDELYWKPGWQNASDEELIDRLGQVVSGDRWVIDGNYHRIQVHFRHRAELIVWLDLPRHTCLRRILARCLRRVWTGEACCNGNHETLRGTFASRESILLYTWRSHPDYRVRYTAELSACPHTRLNSEREAAQWLQSFRRKITMADHT